MNVASVYVWKEWREQRATLAALALVLLAAIALVAATIPREIVGDPVIEQWAIGLALIATVMSVGADLFARERQRGALQFLERAPRGLEAAFRGKLCFFALVVCGALAYASALAAGAVLARTGEWPRSLFDGAPVWIPAAAFAASLWALVLSACMPSSALTLPATIAFFALYAWPAVLAVRGMPLFLPTPAEAIAFVALCTIGAPVSAWAAFVIGSRRGRTRAHAAVAGACAAIPFFAPAWIWAGARYMALERAPFEILHAWVGPGERFAFVDLARVAPKNASPAEAARFDRTSAVVVDLESREWKLAGDVDASAFVADREDERRRGLFGASACRDLALLDTRAPGTRALVDASTGRMLAPGEAHDRAAELPSPADFGLATAPATYSIRWAGLGQSISFCDGEIDHTIFRDPTRGLVVDRAAILPEHPNGFACDVRVLDGRWLARVGKDWYTIDPVSHTREPSTHIAKVEQLSASVDDGRFVLVARDELCLLDPDTGRREHISIEGTSERVL